MLVILTGKECKYDSVQTCKHKVTLLKYGALHFEMGIFKLYDAHKHDGPVTITWYIVMYKEPFIMYR